MKDAVRHKQVFQLRWTVTPKAPGSVPPRTKSKISVRVENTSTNEYYYERLMVKFPSGSSTRDLFCADKFSVDVDPQSDEIENMQMSIAPLKETISQKRLKKAEIVETKSKIHERME